MNLVKIIGELSTAVDQPEGSDQTEQPQSQAGKSYINILIEFVQYLIIIKS